MCVNGDGEALKGDEEESFKERYGCAKCSRESLKGKGEA